MSGYLDNSGRDDVLSGGVRMIPIDTPKGTFRVWTKRVGNNPRLQVLLLHGGPGRDPRVPRGVRQLPARRRGSSTTTTTSSAPGYSDQPDEPSLWELDRFVDEVEQVRQALGLDRDNFVLLGQSWGGILAIEYALRYQQHLHGLVISNMMASVPAYNAYAEQVLMPAMDQAALAEIKALEASGDIENPRYMELLIEQHYVHHVLRMPVEDWPDPVKRAFAHINPAIYVPMQGPSELGVSGASSPTGTAPPTSPRSTCRRSSSARSTTRWTRRTWRGWPSACRRAATSTAPTAATWRCTTTRQRTSPA